MSRDVKVEVSIPGLAAQDDDTKEREEMHVALVYRAGKVFVKVNWWGPEVEIDFDNLADAFETIRAVHRAELRTIMGRPAIEIAGLA